MQSDFVHERQLIIIKQNHTFVPRYYYQLLFDLLTICAYIGVACAVYSNLSRNLCIIIIILHSQHFGTMTQLEMVFQDLLSCVAQKDKPVVSSYVTGMHVLP